VALSETGQAWERLIDQLKERGLSGVEVATSDAHEGLKQALREAFPGLIWQRCQAHFKRNVMDQDRSCSHRARPWSAGATGASCPEVATLPTLESVAISEAAFASISSDEIAAS
jgi:hypothetical protein